MIVYDPLLVSDNDTAQKRIISISKTSDKQIHTRSAKFYLGNFCRTQLLHLQYKLNASNAFAGMYITKCEDNKIEANCFIKNEKNIRRGAMLTG